LLPDLSLSVHDSIIARARHAAGVSQAELARQFGVSYQRGHQIVHGRRGQAITQTPLPRDVCCERAPHLTEWQDYGTVHRV